MKVLFSHSLPFFLAHGGSQTLIEALMRELANLGVKVEPVRWWDENQTGDIIHYVGRPNSHNIRLAHEKKFKVVMTDLLDQTASRSRSRLFLQRTVIRTVRTVARGLAGNFRWGLYQEMDAMVFAVGHEWEVATISFAAQPERGIVIPHGLETEALKQLGMPAAEEDYLVFCADDLPAKESGAAGRGAPASPKFRLSFSASPSHRTTTIFSASKNWWMINTSATPAL